MIERAVHGKPAPYYVAAPAYGQGPGVIVLHAWWGLNPFFKDLCDRLAKEGFVAVAPDLYSAEPARTVEEAQAVQAKLDYIEAKTRVTGAAELLHEHPAVSGSDFGVIGFSMGAAWALLLSTLDPAEIAACVAFYGIGEGDFERARAAYLGHFAEVDEWEPVAEVRRMEQAIRAAGREVTFHYYPDVGHWFFEEDRPDSYHAASARLAWKRTIDFLKETLRG